MERKKKKQPSDYAQFAFRVPAGADMESLMREIEDLRAARNKGRKEDERVINKNDVILEALSLGLAAMKRKEKK